MKRSREQWGTSSEAIIASSSEFLIAETATFRKHVEKALSQRYYKRLLEDVYPVLRSNPYFGPNIKRLKGDMKSAFRYRIGDYRLFYTIDPDKRHVYVLALQNRKDSYKKR